MKNDFILGDRFVSGVKKLLEKHGRNIEDGNEDGYISDLVNLIMTEEV